jgi:hypothetical protein
MTDSELVKNAAFIEVSAGVRYWEDSSINGVGDEDGKIPFREGDMWRPVIELSTGRIDRWPDGIEADVHYKVCDEGEYWLLDADSRRIAKWNLNYVPDSFLCVGADGYGDYIIFKIGGDGKIVGWVKPVIDLDEWGLV